MTSSADLAGFIRRAPIPMVLARGSSHEIIVASRGFASLVGHTMDELADRPVATLFERSAGLAARLDEVERTGTPAGGFPARIGGDGGVLVSAWPVEDGSEPTRLALIVVGGAGADDHAGERVAGNLREVNEALVLEALEARDRAAEAREENRAKSVFLASVSHELRTPLNSIVGHAQLLEEGIPVPLPDGLRRHVKRIQTASNHLLDLIQQIIAAASAEAGEEADRHPVDVRALAEDAAAMIASRAEEKGLEVGVEIDGECDTFVSNRQHLRQILVNLLSNAVKFTDEGSVRLEVRCGEEYRFRVSDTGEGIPAEEREQIFGRFWQGGGEDPAPREGMGIGLWVTRTLVEGLGGRILVESEVGRGSTFEVILPAEG